MERYLRYPIDTYCKNKKGKTFIINSKTTLQTPSHEYLHFLKITHTLYMVLLVLTYVAKCTFRFLIEISFRYKNVHHVYGSSNIPVTRLLKLW